LLSHILILRRINSNNYQGTVYIIIFTENKKAINMDINLKLQKYSSLAPKKQNTAKRSFQMTAKKPS
jgi:hypothetical protein